LNILGPFAPEIRVIRAARQNPYRVIGASEETAGIRAAKTAPRGHGATRATRGSLAGA
jgi:hypothetical protein